MTKLLDKKVIKNTFKQLLNTYILVLVIGIAAVIFMYKTHYYDMGRFLTMSTSYDLCRTPLQWVTIVGSVLLSFTALKFTWSKKRADFEYSLPVTKGRLYSSKAFVAVGLQLVALIIVWFISLITALSFIGRLAFISDMLLYLFQSAASSLLIIGAIFLAASVTGHLLSTGLLTVGILGAPLLVNVSIEYAAFENALVIGALQYLNYSSTLEIVMDTILRGGLPIDTYSPFAEALFTFVIGMLYVIAGYLLFKKRSGELAGKHTQYKLVHYIVMSIPAIPFIFSVALNVAYRNWLGNADMFFAQMTMIYALAGLVLMFAYELIVHRKVRIKNRCIWVYLCVFIISFVMVMIAKWGIEAQVTHKLEYNQVESVNIITDCSYYYSDNTYNAKNRISYGEFTASEWDIEDAEVIKELVEKYNNPMARQDWSNSTDTRLIRFNLKSGKTVEEYVSIDYIYDAETKEGIPNVFYNIVHDKDYYEVYYEEVPVENVVNISCNDDYSKEVSDALTEVYKVFCEEYEELTLEQKDYISENKEDYSGYIHIDVSETVEHRRLGTLFVKGRVDGVNSLDVYHVYTFMPKTCEVFMETLNELYFEDFQTLYSSDADVVGYMEISCEYMYLRPDEHYVNNAEFNQRVIDIFETYAIYSPADGDYVVSVNYYDYKTRDTKTVYLGVDREAVDELYVLFDEMHPDA